MPTSRRPVHVLYGGAHLFKSDVASHMGELARRALEQHAPDPETLANACGFPRQLAETVYLRVVEKLNREPVESLHIDFEDGYGVRSDAEEDAAAHSAAEQLAKGRDEGTLPSFTGIRIKPLNEESRERALRTLRIVLDEMGRIPENFAVVLAKITEADHVRECAEIVTQHGVKRLELMIETPQSVLLLRKFIEELGGLCACAHFGAYDYTASLGIAAPHQDLLHPACDFARGMMQLHLAGTGVELADGATNTLPLGDRESVHRGWWRHCTHIRHSLENGFYRSLDLHPAQLVSRYAAVYAFFLEGVESSSGRLKNFIARAAQATRVGGVFDDAATGQGLLTYFLRAIDCGAIPESEVAALTGLSLEELRSASFVKILEGRSNHARIS